MAKLGVSIRVDVSKIDKSRLYKGEKGTYLDLTTFIDTDQKDKYDNNGFISQSVTKDERAANVQTPILGNVKVFYQDGQQSQPANNNSPAQPASKDAGPDYGGDSSYYDDDIPFAQHMRGTII